MRATPRADRDGRSPYEIITGLKPQGPLARIFERCRGVELTVNEYVKDLVEGIKKVVNGVGTYMSADLANRKLKNEKEDVSSWKPGVGDAVLLRRPPYAAMAMRKAYADGGGISARLLPLTDVRVFHIKKEVGPKTYVLMDPDTGSSDLGFSQPVALARLVPYDACQLEVPINDTEKLWIDIKSNHLGKQDRWFQREIIGQLASGAVRVRSVHGDFEEVIELADYEWRWRIVPKTAAPATTHTPTGATTLSKAE